MRPASDSLPLFGSALLLAGGKSRRMGFDKRIIQLGGESLTSRMIRLLSEQFDDVIVATDRPDLYENEGGAVRAVADVYPGAGPLAGLHAGLAAAASRFVFVTACDMPHLDPAFIARLKRTLTEALADDDAVEGAATWLDDGRIEPLSAFYAASLAAVAEAQLREGNHSLHSLCRTRRFARLSEQEARDVSRHLDVFYNLNRPEDFRKFTGLSQVDSGAPPAVSDDLPSVRRVEAIRVTNDRAAVFTETVLDEAHLVLTVAAAEDGDRTGAGAAADGLLAGGAGTAKGRSADVEKEKTPPGSTFSFFLLPERLDDFIAGFLLSSGRIDEIGELAELSFFRTDAPNNDWSATAALRRLPAEKRSGKRASATAETGEMMAELPLPAAWFCRTLPQLDSLGTRFRLTGATHVLAFYDRQGTIVDVVEDVSRHAALDKLIGNAAKRGIDFSTLLLLTSCRLTSTIVSKAAAVGVPLLASRAAVTARALTLARRYGLRLLGFVREGRLNMFP